MPPVADEPGGGDVPRTQRLDAGVVAHERGIQMVARSLCAGDGLGEQWLDMSWLDEGVVRQISQQALAEQDIVA